MQNDKLGELIYSFIDLMGFTKSELAKLSDLQIRQSKDIEQLEVSQNQLSRTIKQHLSDIQKDYITRINQINDSFEREQAKDREFRERIMFIFGAINVFVVPVIIGVVLVWIEKLIK